MSRRLFVGGITAASLLLPGPALAGIDVSSLRTLPVEGDASGAAARLQQLQMRGTKVERGGADASIMTGSAVQRLPSGVSYTESRSGREGSRSVRRGSNVGAVLAVRTREGRLCYSTKVDNDNNELAWTVGAGDLPRGLEEGMTGMRLDAVRRVEVPAQLVFAARNAGQLPEATTEGGRRCYEEAFRSEDASLVFEVFVTGIRQGDNRI